MNTFVHAIDGFTSRQVWYTDTDSIYIHKHHMPVLESLGLIGCNMGQAKNDYGDGCGIVASHFLGPKQKVMYVYDHGYIKRKVTMKGLYGKQQQSIDMLTIQSIITCGITVHETNTLSKTLWQSNVNGVEPC